MKKDIYTYAKPLNENDLIDNPKHYTQGIECWDYITSHNMSYLEGNIIKYVTRYKDKNGLQDLEKARAYLDKLLAFSSQLKQGDS